MTTGDNSYSERRLLLCFFFFPCVSVKMTHIHVLNIKMLCVEVTQTQFREVIKDVLLNSL